MGMKGFKDYVALVKANVVVATQPKFDSTNSTNNLKTVEYLINRNELYNFTYAKSITNYRLKVILVLSITCGILPLLLLTENDSRYIITWGGGSKLFKSGMSLYEQSGSNSVIFLKQ